MVRDRHRSIAKQIQDILRKKPTHEVVMQDITLQGISLKNLGGNIDLIRHLSSDLAIKIWKNQKIEELIRHSATKLQKIGIHPSVLRKQRFRYLKQLEQDDVLTASLSRLDAPIAPGSLEVMVQSDVSKKEKN
ncbi:hypothetical protein COU89_02395 [Candidatus Roizmanbacteria bacterium CG10_big_fil_rev_8_21_14_0_10_45_7]|uniref:Uncharacterized protein n=1 Tax=Candidatus Roizmanbacteria bacterium CG10_big_fil_rev_8_21_14_0_10_45_7 TaxID=1974854 RepID=A0A2M8KUI8_9BACT|nr:MAG: hypothetical protein COU89_02395 [Candidatus Roizmanbacteria bacterium CG10_big_fil_rev_8_21_14_0_10_45_7]